MEYNKIADIYRQESTHGNHPVELVGKLFEAIIEDLRRALTAVDSGDIPSRTSSLNHALQIIAELQSVLDHERGGEISHRLNGFYNVTRALIIEANAHGTPNHIQRLIELYLPLRQTWKQVERDAAMGKLNMDAQPQVADTAATSAQPSRRAQPEGLPALWSA